MQAFTQMLVKLFGLHAQASELSLRQMCVRGVFIFLSGLVLVRVADKRFFAKKSAFDVLLALILGSILGRAINGSEQLFETVGVSFFLVILHRAMGWAACRWAKFECLVKGHTNVLVKEGEVNKDKLKQHHISAEDLAEQLRIQGNVDGAKKVALAFLERSGEISVIKKEGGS